MLIKLLCILLINSGPEEEKEIQVEVEVPVGYVSYILILPVGFRIPKANL